jgi:hypothetical protein
VTRKKRERLIFVGKLAGWQRWISGRQKTISGHQKTISGGEKKF